ncbi:MAG: glycosyltransferase family 2 protein, partial [Candidatus Omnitrophica bacterium]|nr:glycosyltransferase family 2 protein [Candidatus Omnitrophota bacterium]
KNIMIYIQKYGEDDPDIKRQFSLWYRYFLVFAEHGKWKKLVMHPIAASRMYFLKIIVGIQYLLRRLKK